ncbi:hypothetical protein M9H77_05928 [Catharanthus roseus]|uniref:Uncharacterized protein n=1 Tax=Catharanthus roseus TaxID=4058 RepID=A0ACC0BQN3_CATRO|nr:hypothetical protein M9H77_05928 [Catharanthus roseus]
MLTLNFARSSNHWFAMISLLCKRIFTVLSLTTEDRSILRIENDLFEKLVGARSCGKVRKILLELPVNQKFFKDISIETCRDRAIRKNNPTKGRWASLTNLINKNVDDAIEELRAMMDPFVHAHKGTILQESLPSLRDILVVLNPTDLQQKLLPGNP